jgi:hypothetical protein
MNPKNELKKKLRISRESLRLLTPSDLLAVPGGGGGSSCSCSTAGISISTRHTPTKLGTAD